MNNKLGIVIVAGGTSKRFFGKNKLLEYIPNHILNDPPDITQYGIDSGQLHRQAKTAMPPVYPVFICSLLNFRNACSDHQIVLVCHPELVKEYKKLSNKFIPGNNFIYTIGGTERHNSVINGLNALPDSVKYVAIHDAARPLANKKILNKCLDSCLKKGSGVAAKKINDTIKLATNDGKIIKSIDRTNLWAVETPQIFNIDDLKSAYQKLLQGNMAVTDDAGVMEYAGFSVYLVENHDINTKITYQSDIDYIRTLVPWSSIAATKS